MTRQPAINSTYEVKRVLALRLRLHRLLRDNPSLQAIVRTLCARSPLFWMRAFAWTFDPRQRQPLLPFLPYPFQAELIGKLQRHIHGNPSPIPLPKGEGMTGAILRDIQKNQDRSLVLPSPYGYQDSLSSARHLDRKGRGRGEGFQSLLPTDLLIEKSRDMGVSWLVCLLFQHDWLFGQGANYLLGSRKLDLVDRKGDLSSLFEKLRFNLRYQPQWLLPQGYDPIRHDCQGKLVNPANHSTLTGEAATGNFARGGRYRAVLLDEFAFWEQGDEAWTSAGQSSPCRLAISTPHGKYNAFARVRFGGRTAVARVHWRLHPHRDEGWYERQCARMSPDEVARELDINYNFSVAGRMFPQFGPQHITELKVLENRRLTRVWDFGYHAPACLWLQVDDLGRLLVLREEVGQCEQLLEFAQRVKEITAREFPQVGAVEDWCDPAGRQRSDKTEATSVSILNGLGIYPSTANNDRREGVDRVRHLLGARRNETPALLVDSLRCPVTVEALSGAYRSKANDPDEAVEEHPYEDVMDCLRYGVMARGEVWSAAERLAQRRNHRARLYIVPRDPGTGY